MILRRLMIAGIFLIVAGGLWWSLPQRVEKNDSIIADEVVPTLVAEIPQARYVTSASCRDCHAEQYASWHRTHHRTMTQLVSEETLLAPIDNTVTLNAFGRTTTISKEDDGYWIELIDPEWEMDLYDRGMAAFIDPDRAPVVKRKLVMSTGAHHMQIFWINGTNGNRMHQVPWVWHVLEQRWIPLTSIFILPPETGPTLHATWNDVCIHCHTVRGQPGLSDDGIYNSRVTEYGVSCEACHGPGQAHEKLHRQLAASGESIHPEDDPIIHPAKLDHERSAQVCGSCHSDYAIDNDQFWITGHSFEPGEDLLTSRLFPQHQPDAGMDGYWDDGTARVGGREFTAMAQSKCYIAGEMDCLSCHSMHNSDPNDQLIPSLLGDESCFQCHENYRANIAEHTHHPVGSSGAACMNCHMPYSSFVLMKGIRCHRIDSPTVEMTKRHGRPNACNQCHLDQSLAWTNELLNEWYGQNKLTLDETESSLSVASRHLLKGDAVQRAVAAANFSSDEALDVSGTGWQAPLLAQLLNDPYPVVRFRAWKAFLKLPGFASFEYDFTAEEPELTLAVERAMNIWKSTERTNTILPAGLFDDDGEVNLELVRELVEERDDRPVFLPE